MQQPPKIPAHYRGDPVAVRLISLGISIDYVDALVERAAILEFCAGQTREDAERDAVMLTM